ncbi:hypothetical protein [Stomatohabitans albus]|uniref:hypothetical protein n=1 Tax=Stomatohabitans albus TaxID=3110766 RepID=UPI00300C6752
MAKNPALGGQLRRSDPFCDCRSLPRRSVRRLLQDAQPQRAGDRDGGLIPLRRRRHPDVAAHRVLGVVD